MNITEILENNGIKFKEFGFKGSCYGRQETFPAVVSNYRTVRYGYLQNYYKGSHLVGNWAMVYERFSEGSAEFPSSYYCIYIYVKDKDYIKSIKLLSKYNKIKKFIVKWMINSLPSVSKYYSYKIRWGDFQQLFIFF